MRFKKGTKVEVQSKKDVPSGSWRCAEIINGNGKNYTVKYDGHVGAADETTMERVSGNIIRPRPPLLEVSERPFPSDVVEVFDNFSWKMAAVLSVLGKTNYLVRLLGSSLELKVGKFDIRTRQSWQNNKWIAIGKGHGNCEDGKRNDIVTLEKNPTLRARFKQMNARVNSRTKNNHFHNNSEVNFEVNNIGLCKSLKRRSPPRHSQAEPSAEAPRKIEQECRLYRLACITQPTLHANVEAVAFPREMFDEKCMRSFFDKRTTGFSEVDPARKNPTGTAGCLFHANLESNDADSITCSVGSCSITSNASYKFPRREFAGFTEDVDVLSSDAESSCQLGYEEGNCLLPKHEGVAAEIHRAEAGSVNTLVPNV
ncbi:uncharacterized protein LOC119995863 isoform X2 [Tripterygium wilfordii]|uniref:uncharacterized protein LOC119995863 isoform X2 n=1 Tax=Tripterygium wilfordii TaxID=458696 RepID=UPI0018F83D7E|nr:uncharacterized protein LOC119995863 isoform X2 [Tripterygium wilfordii]XP_038698251.1 uncharacterized protein LOC119995863 isoform X2 [Tripterygium wilfordii]